MTEPKKLIEAILFMSSKPVAIGELSKATGIAAHGFVKNIINEIRNDYEKKDSVITIIEESTGEFLMTIKKKYIPIIKSYAKETYFAKQELSVLAYLSHNKEVVKSDLVKLLGPEIYGAVKELRQKGFVEQKKFGRSSKLKLTKKFESHFSQGGPAQSTLDLGQENTQE